MAKVTINMIAEKAGVSRGTVDRVLHNRGEVAESVRDHVLAVAKLLDYPLPGESPLKKKKPSHLIGAILPGNRWFDDNLKREWMRGLQDAKDIVEPLGYKVVLVECETDTPGEIVEAAEALRARKPDGLSLTGMDTDLMRSCIDSFAENGIPVVTYNSDLPQSKRACYVGQDPYRGGRVAANMAFRRIGEGERILAVAGNLGYAAHESRIQGFLDACAEAGIRKDQIVVKESHNEYYLTYEIVKKALSEMPDLRMIYMANESVAACADALGDQRKERGIMVVGNDLTTVTRKLLMEDRIDFIIEQNIYWQGYQPIILLKKLIEIPAFPIRENVFSNISVVNAESIR